MKGKGKKLAAVAVAAVIGISSFTAYAGQLPEGEGAAYSSSGASEIINGPVRIRYQDWKVGVGNSATYLNLAVSVTPDRSDVQRMEYRITGYDDTPTNMENFAEVPSDGRITWQGIYRTARQDLSGTLEIRAYLLSGEVVTASESFNFTNSQYQPQHREPIATSSLELGSGQASIYGVTGLLTAKAESTFFTFHSLTTSVKWEVVPPDGGRPTEIGFVDYDGALDGYRMTIPLSGVLHAGDHVRVTVSMTANGEYESVRESKVYDFLVP